VNLVKNFFKERESVIHKLGFGLIGLAGVLTVFSIGSNYVSEELEVKGFLIVLFALGLLLVYFTIPNTL